MSSHPTHPQPNDPGQQAADAHHYREVLHDLIGMGTTLARRLHDQAIAPAPRPAHAPAAPSPAPDLIALATAFDRIARAVRRSIALARTLAQPVAPAQDPAANRAAARKRILREVEDAIQRRHHEGDTAEDLNAELHDRLDGPDLDDDIATRPTPDIIAEICRDLGLAALPGTDPWKRRTPADIRMLCTRAAATNRPGAAPQPTPSTPDPAPAGPPPSPAPSRPAEADWTASTTPDPDNLPDGAIPAANILHYPPTPRDRWRPPPWP